MGLELMPGVEAILRRVRLHDAIEATPCPGCGAAIRVDFWPEGRFFQVRCAGRPLHLSVLQEIDTPPHWWRARVVEPVESIVTYFADAPQADA
jgi:hypothetical protein